MESKKERKKADSLKKFLRLDNILFGNIFLRQCVKVSLFMGLICYIVLMCSAISEAKSSVGTDIEYVETCEENLENDSFVPISVDEYAYNNYESVIEAVKKFKYIYHLTKEQLSCVKLGEPFVVNDIKQKSQEEIYYYPVLDSNDKVILLMSVIKTTDGWTHSISDEWVSGLNNLSQITSDYIFYKSEENLYAENKKNKYVIQGNENADIQFYSLKNYSEKRKDVYNTVKNFKETDTNDCLNEFCNVKAGYTPSFSSSTSSLKTCALYNKKNQGNTALCWAASVATVCNFRNGTNITPIQIANAMGIGIFDGASLKATQDALKYYGVSYDVLKLNSSDIMSWSDVKKNVNGKFPVMACTYAADRTMAHMVTVYGYTTAAGVNYIILWNSGANNGQGSSATVEFKSKGTSFGYDNTTFVWKKSISKY